LASNRARAHENIATSEGPRGGQKYEEIRQNQRGSAQDGTSQTGSSSFGEALPLLPLGNPDHKRADLERIRYGMCKSLSPFPTATQTDAHFRVHLNVFFPMVREC